MGKHTHTHTRIALADVFVCTSSVWCLGIANGVDDDEDGDDDDGDKAAGDVEHTRNGVDAENENFLAIQEPSHTLIIAHIVGRKTRVGEKNTLGILFVSVVAHICRRTTHKGGGVNSKNVQCVRLVRTCFPKFMNQFPNMTHARMIHFSNTVKCHVLFTFWRW